MCNAKYHPPDCECGWGGVGHKGRGGSRGYEQENLKSCGPTTCPECRSGVYFIRHNGGSVWVDELGWPWPRHPCFPPIGHDKLSSLRAPQGKPLSDLWPAIVQKVNYFQGTTTLLVKRVQDGVGFLLYAGGNTTVLDGEVVLLSHKTSTLISTCPGCQEVLVPALASVESPKAFASNDGPKIMPLAVEIESQSQTPPSVVADPVSPIQPHQRQCPVCGKIKKGLDDHIRHKHPGFAERSKQSIPPVAVEPINPLQSNTLPAIDITPLAPEAENTADVTTEGNVDGMPIEEESSAERFEKNNDGTVTDRQTGLVWEECDNGADITFEDAMNHCDAEDGWRMPTKDELLELCIVGYRTGLPGPINLSGMECQVWASDTVSAADLPSFVLPEETGTWAFYVCFFNGSIGVARRANSSNGRALRIYEPTPVERFVKNEDGTVTDTDTGLLWAGSDNGADITFDEAIAYCAKGDGWRMPTNAELSVLYDEGLRKGKSGATKITLTKERVWIADPVKQSDFPLGRKSEDPRAWALIIHFNVGQDVAIPRWHDCGYRVLPVCDKWPDRDDE